MILKAIAVGALIAFGEVLNGIFRVRVLQRKHGRKKGKQMSFFLGTCLFVVVAWLLIPWVNPGSYADSLLVGFIWVVMLTALDLYFGRFVFRFSWKRIAEDFDPTKGNLLGIGMVLLLLCPMLAHSLK